MKRNDYNKHTSGRQRPLRGRLCRVSALMLALAGITLLAASCTTDDVGSIPGDGSRTPVTFTAAIQDAATTHTRTAPGADETQTRWTADDRIAVFMLPAGGKIPADTLPDAHNVPYSIDPATGAMTQAVPEVFVPDAGGFVPGTIVSMYYPMTDGEVDFVAYYPYDPTLETDAPKLPDPYIRGVVLLDQTTPEKQFEADFLFSDNARGISRSKDAVPLRFRHLNAKLRLNITLAEGLAGGKVTEVKLSGISIGVTFDMRDGSVNQLFTPSSQTAPILCLPLPSPAAGTGADASFTALVPPHSGADYGGRKVTVSVDGEEYTGTLPDAHAYLGNTMYAYPVRVTPRGITISAPNTDVPWTDAQALPKGYDLTIANETELREFARKVNAGETLPNGTPAAEAKVLQTADITLTQGEWTPIGNGDYGFRGAYNGDGHPITGLTITTAPAPDAYGDAYAGLFGSSMGVLTGIHLREVKIDVQADSDIEALYVGSIAGVIGNTTLSLCSASGTVKASSGAKDVSAGGIAGASMYCTISRCRASVETKAASTRTDGNAYAGEIAGTNNPSSFILSCEVQGRAVTAEGGKSASAGGITGWNTATSLIAFCRTGANVVTAQDGTYVNYAGGLVGNNGGYLYSCYSRATAMATGGTLNQAGAIVGDKSATPGSEQHCYGAGSTGLGTSDLPADPAPGIFYETSPGHDAIFNVMKGYADRVKSITYQTGETVYPTSTRYTPSLYPSHGIEPVRVTWGPGEQVWQRGTDVKYPEINMKYGGDPSGVAP